MLCLDRLGYIRSGDMRDFYIKIMYDKMTDGFFVFYSKEPGNKYAEGYDEWYENYKTVNDLFGKRDIAWT